MCLSACVCVCVCLCVQPTMTNWLPGEPDNAGGSENCVQMVGAARRDHAGAWSDNDCNQRSDFICQKPTSRSPRLPVELGPSCEKAQSIYRCERLNVDEGPVQQTLYALTPSPFEPVQFPG